MLASCRGLSVQPICLLDGCEVWPSSAWIYSQATGWSMLAVEREAAFLTSSKRSVRRVGWWGLKKIRSCIDRPENLIGESGWRNVQVIEADAQAAVLQRQFAGLLMFAAHEILNSPAALDNLLACLKDRARVVAFGAKQANSLPGRIANPLLRLASRHWLPASAPIGSKPWRLLEARMDPLAVDERFFGIFYLVSGALPVQVGERSNMKAQMTGAAPGIGPNILSAVLLEATAQVIRRAYDPYVLDDRDHYLPCSRWPSLLEVERILQEHQATLRQIEQVNPGNAGVEVDSTACPGKADLVIWYATRQNRLAIEADDRRTNFFTGSRTGCRTGDHFRDRRLTPGPGKMRG